MRSILNAISWIVIVGSLGVGLVIADQLGERGVEKGYTPKAAVEAAPSETPAVEIPGTNQKLVGMQTAKTTKRQGQRTVRATCQVQLDANHQVLVKSFVTGFVEERLCEQGDLVRAGQPLFVMRSNDLALAKGNYLSGKAQLDLTRVVLDRDEILIKDKIVSQTQLDTDRAAWLQARTAFVNAREQLLIDGLDEAGIAAISYENQASWVTAVVTSPIDGEVIQLTNAHTRGDLVPSGTDLCQVGDLVHVWVIGNAYEKDISQIRSGSTARLELVSYPGHTWSGHVATVADYVNPTTRTVDVRIVVDNKSADDSTPGRFPLKPGMFGFADIETETYPPDWVWMPEAALLPYFFEDGTKEVFVATDPTHFAERKVRVVSQDGPNVAVTGDVAEGETVVTQGNIFVARSGEKH
jgi:cobalt-zinc-cadmium efflux system membrane fusion protein